jgi:hypothetical protein
MCNLHGANQCANLSGHASVRIVQSTLVRSPLTRARKSVLLRLASGRLSRVGGRHRHASVTSGPTESNTEDDMSDGSGAGARL